MTNDERDQANSEQGGDLRVDVAIVGGGLAGGSLALALAGAGFRVALVDATDPSVMRDAAFDGRTTALAYATARMFRRLGLWDAIAPSAEPIRDILVTDGALESPSRRGGVVDSHLWFDGAALDGEPYLGWIVENQIIRNALFDAIEATDAITLLAPASASGTSFDAGAARISLKDGRRIFADLAVAADGKRSALAAAADIRSHAWGYGQKAIVCSVAHERSHDGVAQEYFLPGGPFAILPMTNSRCSLVWTERADAADAYIALPDDAFLEAIGARFGVYLGALSLASPRWSFPLGFHFSESFVARRLALVGDAARAIHPIAGQGFNLGLKDVAALVDVLTSARGLGRDIGDLSVLDEYDRWRRFDSAALAFGTDMLNRLFSNDVGPIRAARRLGLSAVNALGPLKRTFMRESGADLGRLPSLLQPERVSSAP
ncbi:MAG: FAD-binding protein [Alphaproteobacteria bacterium]|nr:FAD-binding protein [Alphaproteobacteria bacterium]